MCEQRNAALVRATLGEGRSECVRQAKVLGDSFGAGAGVGVPLALVVGYLCLCFYQWIWSGVDMCLFGSFNVAVCSERTAHKVL